MPGERKRRQNRPKPEEQGLPLLAPVAAHVLRISFLLDGQAELHLLLALNERVIRLRVQHFPCFAVAAGFEGPVDKVPGGATPVVRPRSPFDPKKNHAGFRVWGF